MCTLGRGRHAARYERANCLIKDRLLSRFSGAVCRFNSGRQHDLEFREALKKVAAIEGFFLRFDAALRASGFPAMSRQIAPRNNYRGA